MHWQGEISSSQVGGGVREKSRKERERESREWLGLVELRPLKEAWLKYKSRRESGGPGSTVSGPYSLLISPGPSFHISEDDTRPVNLSVRYKVLYAM